MRRRENGASASIASPTPIVSRLAGSISPDVSRLNPTAALVTTAASRSSARSFTAVVRGSTISVTSRITSSTPASLAIAKTTSTTSSTPSTVSVGGLRLTSDKVNDPQAAIIAGSILGAATLIILLLVVIWIWRHRGEKNRSAVLRRSRAFPVPTTREVNSWRQPSMNMVEAVHPSNSRVDRHIRLSGTLATRQAPSRPTLPAIIPVPDSDVSTERTSIYNQQHMRVVFAGRPPPPREIGAAMGQDLDHASSNEYLDRLGSYIDTGPAQTSSEAAPEQNPGKQGTPSAGVVPVPAPAASRGSMASGRSSLSSPPDIATPFSWEEEQHDPTPSIYPSFFQWRLMRSTTTPPVHYPRTSEIRRFDFAPG